MKKQERVLAVFDEELINLLGSLNELPKIESGERFCNICNDTILFNNISIIVPQEDKKVIYVCNKPSCVEAYSLKQDGTK
jgi:hypothetical protein